MKTALRLRARAFAFLCRRSTVAALMVLSYLVAMIGYPIVAMLAFAAATQGWFVRRSRWYELCGTLAGYFHIAQARILDGLDHPEISP